jgi:hypothetical protein
LRARTSHLLRSLTESVEDGRVSIGEIVTALGDRGFGLMLLAFALPCCLPMPPGVPSTAGWIIAFIALNMIVGRDSIWLPRSLCLLSVERQTLHRIVNRCVPHVERMERLCRPRIGFALSRGGRAVIAAAMLIPAILLILPIPIFGNVPPGIAAAVIAVAVSEGDGLIALAGALLAIVVLAVTATAAWALAEGLLGVL